MPKPVKVSIDHSLKAWQPEIEYVFRTLVRLAGCPLEFYWVTAATSDSEAGIYYGKDIENSNACLKIPAANLDFITAGDRDPLKYEHVDQTPYIIFQGFEAHQPQLDQRRIVFKYDIIYTSFWFLSGVREPSYSRSRMDDLDLAGTFFLKESLTQKPLVSIYANILRLFFEQNGFEPEKFPWVHGSKKAAFMFTHDVDYPQIIKWIETLRLLKNKGSKAADSIRGVWNGSNNFWKFKDWVEFEHQFGARPAFYFMSRQGSLVKYAFGTPDAFYNISRPEFQTLFGYLRDQGCEIGLHASYHAHRSSEQFRLEKEALEKAASVTISGNRHHYWHLDPDQPWETLTYGEVAGLSYDSSLEFEYYPGFRRGVCHPFHPYHPGLRREMAILELPPTWMDDHFVNRLTKNHITDPILFAKSLMSLAVSLGGTVLLDYHVRGMNTEFYPGYGRWLMELLETIDPLDFSFQTPRDLCNDYLIYENRLLN